jgi:hypothetical protein
MALRGGDARLRGLLEDGAVFVHPFVIAEIALGRIRDRAAVIGLLRELPRVPVATFDELLGFTDAHRLDGAGIGFVDASLLASALLDGGVRLWTRDRALREAAGTLGVAHPA